MVGMQLVRSHTFLRWLGGGIPQVRAQLPPFDYAVGLTLNTEGEGVRRLRISTQDRMEVRVIRIQFTREGRNIGDSSPEISHAESMGIDPIECKPLPHVIFYQGPHPDEMDIWAHRTAFIEAVKAHRKVSGLKLGEIAPLIGLKESTLKDYLYRNDAKPSLEVLQAASTLFGCSLLEFVDDPGGQPPGGVADDVFRYGTEEDRVFLRAMGSNIQGLTPEQKRNAMEACLAVLRGIRGK